MKWKINILQNKEFKQAEQELNILKDDVIAAQKFFRKNRRTLFSNKKKIPVYLVLGPSRFGKTTILSRAGLALKNVDSQALDSVAPTKYCSFWFSQNALYVDTPGIYTRPDITKPRNDIIWQGFIKLLQKYFGKNAIAGSMIVLDLPAIASDSELLKKTLFCIRERVYTLASFIKNLPLHIVFTKCDRILGFLEFFSLLNEEERTQIFGIDFTADKDKIDPIPTFEPKFNELLKQLNNRIIERLHRASTSEERIRIKAFPSQLNNLRALFVDVLSKIPSSRQILLSGIYFTSSTQSGSSIDTIRPQILHSFNLREKTGYGLEAVGNSSYFVEDIFKKIIPGTGQNNQPSLYATYKDFVNVPLNYVFSFLLAGAILGTSSFIGYKGYYKNTRALIGVKLYLQKNPTTGDINDLQVVSDNLNHAANSWWLILGVNEAKQVDTAVENVLQTALFHTLAAQLENRIAELINDQQSVANPRDLYNTLQVYMMLGDSKKLNRSYVKGWFANYWAGISENNSTAKAEPQRGLESALQNPPQIKLNQQTINAARIKLNAAPPLQLIYLLLENTYVDKGFIVDTEEPISAMYTAKNFQKIYNEQIPNILKKPPQNDWVLGSDFAAKIKPASVNSLTQEMQNLYVENYISVWKKIASFGPKIDFKNLDQAAQKLNELAAENSPLIKLLQQIQTNTKIGGVPQNVINDFKEKLHSRDVGDLVTIRNNIGLFAKYINEIAQSKNTKQAAFDAVLNHLQNDDPDALTIFKDFADNESSLLKPWLQALEKNAWGILLNLTHDHINESWNNMIVVAYKASLANKYPLFKDATDDTSLDDFNNFFGPHGLIDGFFNKYIKPFINTDRTNWTWKNLDGQKMSFSQNALEVFLRAALIQKMFYSQKTQTAKLQFTLIPLSMTPETQGFTLHLEGQKIIFTSENKKMASVTWPGSNQGSVTIDFVTRQGKYFTSSQFGPWAWFRTIDKASLDPTGSTRRFAITFGLAGNAAKFELYTPEALNPFIPEIINNFRCPEQLN